MPPAIRVSHLSKSYRVSHAGARPDTFTDLLTELMRRPFRRGGGTPADETFWALRDVSFDVQPGEVIGIIGRNGAGKSTLLKIVSRITAPTEGRVELRGRVASLLEVGTGFHPELTGRDNIYMNGSILGMKRAEIARKFDAIVDFAGVERFLDTPLKRYSSGMYVRLAFAVAAHLDPEILIVDEVLAVGDADFQRKCLGSMQDAASHGRTVLFVSHNMPMVERLCGRAILLANGSAVLDDTVQAVLREYLRHQQTLVDSDLATRTDRGGSGSARIKRVTFTHLDDSGPPFRCGDRWKVSVSYESTSAGFYRFQLGIHDVNGAGLVRLDSHASGSLIDRLSATGTVTCVTEPLRLTPGVCTVNVALTDGTEVLDQVSDALTFEILPADVLGGGLTFARSEAAWVAGQEWAKAR